MEKAPGQKIAAREMTGSGTKAAATKPWPLRVLGLGLTAFGLLFPILVLMGWAKTQHRFYLYWPTVVSTTLLFSFGRTLWVPPSMVERFARLQKSFLNEKEIGYCRTVTKVWCFFFLGNGLLALTLALRGPIKAWALFTGLISYFLIGTLFALEYLYRHWRFRPEGAFLTVWMNRWGHETPRL